MYTGILQLIASNRTTNNREPYNDMLRNNVSSIYIVAVSIELILPILVLFVYEVCDDTLLVVDIEDIGIEDIIITIIIKLHIASAKNAAIEN
jgi:hypothetical protein